MNAEETAQKLELAAQILRTNHPWEYQADYHTWQRSVGRCPLFAIQQRWPIRLALATPPDNCPLHNPDNLTAEQVGVGYRLALKGEALEDGGEIWTGTTWLKSHGCKYVKEATFRLPLSVPWPEPADPYAELKAAHAAGKVIQFIGEDRLGPVAVRPPFEVFRVQDLRIAESEHKPEEPVFQLPPPPPGMRWHREDGWKEGDLPSGYRPLVLLEVPHKGDEHEVRSGRWFAQSTVGLKLLPDATQTRQRTTRPLTFEHAGKTWTWHKPGDPMPCDGDALIHCIMGGDVASKLGTTLIKASCVRWTAVNPESDILGWRYADEKKTVPLGPEDVPPGSVFRYKGENMSRPGYCVAGSVDLDGCEFASRQRHFGTTLVGWGALAEEWQINRSIPLTGKWNPDAWEPCSKEVPA